LLVTHRDWNTSSESLALHGASLIRLGQPLSTSRPELEALANLKQDKPGIAPAEWQDKLGQSHAQAEIGKPVQDSEEEPI
jgi:hypothetical protein